MKGAAQRDALAIYAQAFSTTLVEEIPDEELDTGATNVDSGTLRAGAANTFGKISAFNVALGATLGLAGNSQTLASVRRRAAAVGQCLARSRTPPICGSPLDGRFRSYRRPAQHAPL